MRNFFSVFPYPDFAICSSCRPCSSSRAWSVSRLCRMRNFFSVFPYPDFAICSSCRPCSSSRAWSVSRFGYLSLAMLVSIQCEDMLNDGTMISRTMEQINVETSVVPNQNGQLTQIDICDEDSIDIWGEDDISFADDKDSSDSYVLNREWERRQSQFHTMGFRDGITKGKEDSAQEGFNQGFKESVHAGYSWGLVRGISSVISTLPDQLKEKLISNQQNKDRFQKLYESIQAISSNEALQIFYSSLQKNGSSCNELDSLTEDLNVILCGSEELQVDIDQIKNSVING